MRKWKKLLLPAMCAFMLQIPVIVNAEAVDSSNNVTSAVETPVATPTPALLDGIVKKGSRTYFYKNGVMQKNCWSPDKSSILVRMALLTLPRRYLAVRRIL